MTPLPFVAADPAVPAGVAALPLNGTLPLNTLAHPIPEGLAPFGDLVDQALATPGSGPDAAPSGRSAGSDPAIGQDGEPASSVDGPSDADPAADDLAASLTDVRSEVKSSTAGGVTSSNRARRGMTTSAPTHRRAGEMNPGTAPNAAEAEPGASASEASADSDVTSGDPLTRDDAKSPALPASVSRSPSTVSMPPVETGGEPVAPLLTAPLPDPRSLPKSTPESNPRSDATAGDVRTMSATTSAATSATTSSATAASAVGPAPLSTKADAPNPAVASGATASTEPRAVETSPVEPHAAARRPAVAARPAARHSEAPAASESRAPETAAPREASPSIPGFAAASPAPARPLPAAAAPLATPLVSAATDAPLRTPSASPATDAGSADTGVGVASLPIEADNPTALEVQGSPTTTTGRRFEESKQAEVLNGQGNVTPHGAVSHAHEKASPARTGTVPVDLVQATTTVPPQALRGAPGEGIPAATVALATEAVPAGPAPATPEKVVPARGPGRTVAGGKNVEARLESPRESGLATGDEASDRIEFMTRRQIPGDVPARAQANARASVARSQGAADESGARTASVASARSMRRPANATNPVHAGATLLSRSSREIAVQGDLRPRGDATVPPLGATAMGARAALDGAHASTASEGAALREFPDSGLPRSVASGASTPVAPARVAKGETGLDQTAPPEFSGSESSDPMTGDALPPRAWARGTAVEIGLVGQNAAREEARFRDAAPLVSVDASTSNVTLAETGPRPDGSETSLRKSVREETAASQGRAADSAAGQETARGEAQGAKAHDAVAAARGGSTAPVAGQPESRVQPETRGPEGRGADGAQPLRMERSPDRQEVAKTAGGEVATPASAVVRDRWTAGTGAGDALAERLIRQIEASERHWAGQMRGGTPIAEVGEVMRKERKPTKAAEVGANFLPADRKTSSAREAGVTTLAEAPMGRPISPNAATPERIADLLLEDLMSVPYRVSRSEESRWTDRLGASSSAEAVERIGRLESLISREVVAVRHLGAHSLSVMLRPDADTELMVQLQQHQGAVEAAVKCDRGDLKELQAHWPMLRDALAEQNIRLLPLQSATSTSGDSHSHGSAGRQFSSEERAFRQGAAGGEGRHPGHGEEPRSRSEEAVLTTSRSASGPGPGTARARGARRDGWEFWA